MTIVLKPGETLDVTFHGGDGCITVGYENPDNESWRVFVTADLPDSSGRNGVVYEEIGRVPDLEDEVYEELKSATKLKEQVKFRVYAHGFGYLPSDFDTRKEAESAARQLKTLNWWLNPKVEQTR